MDAQTLAQSLSKPEAEGARLIIDLSVWRFVHEQGGILYFQHIDRRPGLYGVAAELISHMKLADAPRKDDAQAIREASEQLSELSRRIPSM